MNNAIEGILGIISEKSKESNSEELKIGKMLDAERGALDTLVLEKEDLLFDEQLLKRQLTKLNILFDSQTGIITDNSEYTEPLKAGDIVAVQRLSDSLYCVVGKLVNL